MDPQVEAALIGAGVAAVGIISGAVTSAVNSVSTRRANAAALAAATATNIRTLDAARDDRRWEQKASAYVDAIRVINRRQDRRNAELSTIVTSIPAPATSAGPDLGELEARLIAFAAPPVREAVRAAIQADSAARSAWEMWRATADQQRQHNQMRGAGIPMPAASGADVLAAKVKADEAVSHAVDCDDDAIAAIRADLERPASEDDSGQPGHVAGVPRPAWAGLLPPDPDVSTAS